MVLSDQAWDIVTYWLEHTRAYWNILEQGVQVSNVRAAKRLTQGIIELPFDLSATYKQMNRMKQE